MEYLAQCLALVLLLPMIAHATDLEADKSEATVSTPQETGDAAAVTDRSATRQTALEQRVAAKWDALIRRDFAAAYELTSPAYREAFSLDAFKRNFGNGSVDWQRIEVVSVDFKGNHAAIVSIKVHIVYHDPQSQKSFDMATHVKESWVYADRQWWYLMEG